MENWSEGYYKTLVEIWKNQDNNYWQSISIFIATQGIFFVALFEALKIPGQSGIAAGIGFSLIGITISMEFQLITMRKRAALRLLERQLQLLELRLSGFMDLIKDSNGTVDFSEMDIPSSQELKKVEGFFPMYFWASRSIFFKKKIPPNSEFGRTEFERQIRDYYKSYIQATEGLDWEQYTKSSGRSLIDVSAIGLPCTFVFVWVGIFAAFLVLFFAV